MTCRISNCDQTATLVVVTPNSELTEVCSDCYTSLGWEAVDVVVVEKERGGR